MLINLLQTYLVQHNFPQCTLTRLTLTNIMKLIHVHDTKRYDENMYTSDEHILSQSKTTFLQFQFVCKSRKGWTCSRASIYKHNPTLSF